MVLIVAVFLGGGLSVIAAFFLYLAFFPDRAEKAIGLIAGLISRVFHGLNKTAVAFRVQGTINTARATLMKTAPEAVLDAKLKLRWKDADQAAAVVKDGEILVVMQPADHHEQNVTHALMAFCQRQ